MRDVIQASFVCRWLWAAWHWLGMQWSGSRIRTAFTTVRNGREVSRSSVFSGVWLALHRLAVRIFAALRLDRAFEGSVFKRSFFFFALTAALTPLVPTMAAIAMALVTIISVFINSACDSGKKLYYSPVNKFIYLYALAYAAATVFSVTLRESLYGGGLMVVFALFALVVMNAVKNSGQLERGVRLMVWGGLLVAAYGCYQYVFGASGASAWIDKDMFGDISTRVYSTLQNPNVLSEYLLLVIPFAAACFINAKNPFSRCIYVLITLAMLLCMVLTFSRGGWLGLLFSAAVFLVLLDRRFIILGIAALIALYFVLPDSIIGRFTSIGDLSDGSTSYRVAIWMGSLAMLKDYWLCGIGPGTAAFNQVYPYYSYNTASAQHAHNLFLQITCDGGVCAIAMFVLVIFVYLKTTCAAFSREKNRRRRVFLIASISSVCGFMVQSMTDHTFYNYRVMLVFWIVIAVGMMFAMGFAGEEGAYGQSKGT